MLQQYLKVLPSSSKQIRDVRLGVSGHGAVNKAAQQLSWDRVNAVIKYLVERQGIADNRIIFEYGTEGDQNTVDLMPTTEERT